MATRTFDSLVISTLLAVSAAAFSLNAGAQQRPDDNREQAQQQRQTQNNTQKGRDERAQQPAQRSNANNGSHAAPQSTPRPNADSPRNAQASRASSRGAGPDNRYHQGDTLPAPYQGTKYRVEQPERRGLPAPGHGQRWVKVGADYVLIAIATGLIVDLVLHK